MHVDPVHLVSKMDLVELQPSGLLIMLPHSMVDLIPVKGDERWKNFAYFYDFRGPYCINVAVN